MGHMNRKNIGSSFDSWLREEGIYEEVTATAIKRVPARHVEAAMKEKVRQPAVLYLIPSSFQVGLQIRIQLLADFLD